MINGWSVDRAQFLKELREAVQYASPTIQLQCHTCSCCGGYKCLTIEEMREHHEKMHGLVQITECLPTMGALLPDWDGYDFGQNRNGLNTYKDDWKRRNR